MVGSTIVFLRRSSERKNVRCVPVGEAIELGKQPSTISYPEYVLRGVKGVTHESFLLRNVRVTDEVVTIETQGCFPDHNVPEHLPVTTIARCPEEVAQRCANCILGIAQGDGERIRSQMNAIPQNTPID